MKLDYDRALEEAISTERSTPLPLEAPDCFKVRGLEKVGPNLQKTGEISAKRSGIEHMSIYRGVKGITPLEHLAKYLKRERVNLETDTEDEDIDQEQSHRIELLSDMEGLSATKKEIMVQAILDIANATAD
ncbi:13119_t:CDS:2 [Ambispora gerdemannii]|uniref:13119_t:CDS:1 n=1 Tax=Ambispora gerdemannii TaxID=144530 RepID=A0A9N8ZZ74_9GLOM|nr:13119_t:CDS:2 [Ambispora gerdemannii]